jgi:WD40 repeat protein
MQALTKLLGDFDFAYSKIRLVGIDELLEDLQASKKIFSPSGAVALTELMSILEPEARSLRWWSQNADLTARHSNFPAQQVYNRALHTEADALAAKAKFKLDQLAAPYLAFRWRAGAEPRSTLLQLFFLSKESHPTALAVSHDGRYVVLGYADATVEVLDLSSGNSVKRFSAPGESVILLAANRDGDLISATSDGKFTFWQPETWTAVRTVALPGRSKLRGARITTNGARAVTVTESKEISLWNLETCEQVRLLAKDLSLQDLALSDDGRYAMAGDVAGLLRVWDLKFDTPPRQLNMPVLNKKRPGFWGLLGNLAAKFVGRTAVAISRSNNLAASVHLGSGLNSIIILWDLVGGKWLRQIPCPKEMVQFVRLSDDGRRAIVAGATSAMASIVQIFDTESGNTLALAGIDLPITRLAFSADARDLVVQVADGGINCLRLIEGE